LTDNVVQIMGHSTNDFIWDFCYLRWLLFVEES